MIVENFRARPARACVGHLPEIVGRIAGALVVADTNNALGRNTDFLGPDIVSLIVFVIDGYPKFFCRQLIDSGQEFPGIDRKSVVEGKSGSVRVDLGGGRLL